jgi:15-cis-phytoene synthase
MTEVALSYKHCEQIARTRARNFYYSFLLLPAEKRRAICAVYAFMRRCDDLSDEPGATVEALESWRGSLTGALDGERPPDPLWPAFADTVRRYSIPANYFHEMIDGVESDLTPRCIETFDDLYSYCYRVASVVGLTVTHIYGFDNPKALELAEKCGIAFQITNILRDVHEDEQLGRDYIPSEDRARFEDRRELMRFEARRAQHYYDEARPLLGLIHTDSRASLWAIMEIYRRLLERIEAADYAVWSKRIRIPTWEKASIVAQAFLMRR